MPLYLANGSAVTGAHLPGCQRRSPAKNPAYLMVRERTSRHTGLTATALMRYRCLFAVPGGSQRL